MIDSRGQHVGAAVAAYLDVRVGFCLGPEIHPPHRRTFHAYRRFPDEP
jgi:hypothetical protein